MEFLGFIVSLLSLSAIVWAIIEFIFFVLKVLINPNKYDDRARKRKMILFPISVLWAAASIFLCFHFAKVSAIALTFLILLMFFFGFLPYILIEGIFIELIMLFKSVFFANGKSDKDLRRASLILIPITALLFGVSIIIKFFYERLFNYYV